MAWMHAMCSLPSRELRASCYRSRGRTLVTVVSPGPEARQSAWTLDCPFMGSSPGHDIDRGQA